MSTLAIISATAALAFLLGRLSTVSATRELRGRLVLALHRVHHDALTQIPNRFFAERIFTRLTAEARPAVLALLDLDGFKDVNDAHGHAAGDDLLVAVARRLRTGARTHGGTAARLAGDEFLLILPTHHADNTRAVAEILRQVAEPICVGSDHGPVLIHPGISAGLTIVDGTNAPFDSALREADIALYQAKSRPGSCYTYRPGDHIPLSARGRRLRDERRRQDGRGAAE